MLSLFRFHVARFTFQAGEACLVPTKNLLTVFWPREKKRDQRLDSRDSALLSVQFVREQGVKKRRDATTMRLFRETPQRMYVMHRIVTEKRGI
jgi:hypothetical protein